MIFWKDFVLDDLVGPTLVVPGEDVSCRRTRLGCTGVMEDAIEIQETGQEKRPARMVGLSDLDSSQSGTEASRGTRAQSLRWRGKG